MNYKQKYEEAIERCKSWIRGEHPECFTEAQKAGEFIFPELKESEDERIRKGLIKGLSAMRDIHKHQTFSDDAINIDDAIAWLEKQDNIPHFTFDDILALQCAMKATEKADNELYEQLKSLHDRLHDVYWLEKQGDEPNWCHHKVDLSNCSEEYRKAYYDGWNNCNQQHEQLKAKHKPAEWSDEDEENLNNVVKELDITKRSRDKILYAQYDKLIDWLKSLKPNHWKPSEEQMESIKYFIDFNRPQANASTEGWSEFKHLESLYNDLLKL